MSPNDNTGGVALMIQFVTIDAMQTLIEYKRESDAWADVATRVRKKVEGRLHEKPVGEVDVFSLYSKENGYQNWYAYYLNAEDVDKINNSVDNVISREGRGLGVPGYLDIDYDDVTE